MTHELYITRQGNNAELLDTLMTGWIQSKGKPSDSKRGSDFGVVYAVSNIQTGATRLYFKSAAALAQAKEWALRFTNEKGMNHVNII